MENTRMSFKHICKEDTYMFNYTQLPDELFTVEFFMELSLYAKVLYSFMLRRVSISKENSWIDDEGDVYIYYRTDEIMDKFNCSNKTASKIMAELEEIGLIEKKRQGQGKPDIIYVNKFSALNESEDGEEPELPIENLELLYTEDEQNDEEPVLNSEVKKIHFKKCKNYTSRNVKSTRQEVKNLHANYKDNNYKEKLSSSTMQDMNNLQQKKVVRIRQEEEEGECKRKIKYQEAERLYSAQVAGAVLNELMKRNQEYRERFTAEMFQKVCKSMVVSKEPILHPSGFINWCFDNINFQAKQSPVRDGTQNQFNQFMQREYDFDALEKEILHN